MTNDRITEQAENPKKSRRNSGNMKLKIEFQIERDHAHAVLNALRHSYSQTGVPAIAKVINEIEKDIGVGIHISEAFMYHLSFFTPHKVNMEADLRYHLAFSPNWLAHPNGLASVCNKTLHQITIQFGGEFREILPNHLKSKKLVADVVEILLKHYES
jgi:hypothetical protein